MTSERISPIPSQTTSKSSHRRQKAKKNSDNVSPTNPTDWSKCSLRIELTHSKRITFASAAIRFCIVGSACSNQRLLAALEDRYVYECINDERQAIRTLAETKTLLAQRQLRIYIIDSFDDCIFQYIKENEDIYTISSELVLSCAEKEIVRDLLFERKTEAIVTSPRIFLFQEKIGLCIVNIYQQLQNAL